MSQPDEDPLQTYQHRASIFRVLSVLAALIFVPLAGFTIWDLFQQIMGGMFGDNNHFGWTTLNRMFKYGPYLLGSGLAYLVFGAIREHYEEKLYQLQAAAEAMRMQHPRDPRG